MLKLVVSELADDVLQERNTRVLGRERIQLLELAVRNPQCPGESNKIEWVLTRHSALQ
jgi:hypothetical protein